MTLAALVAATLAEDVGLGDLTTNACVPAGEHGHARVIAKEALVVSGHRVAAEVFRQLGAVWTPRVPDGAAAVRGEVVADVEGELRALLIGERAALNFLMHLCGVATHTRAVVDAAAPMRVVDTRKTTPLLRALEKEAVRHGGGGNHRFGLFDGLLVKDNHIAAAGGVGAAVARARASAHPLVRVEVEVETLAQLDEALAAGADVVMLDNMDEATSIEAVRRVARRMPVEASGNMTPERARRLAAIGVDYVSIGGLIHQARWVDLSMKVAR